MYTTMSRNWWLVALRGLIALIFGTLVLVYPGITLRVLLTIFGIYAIVDGIIIAANAFTFGRQVGREGLFLLGGLFGILIGVIAFLAPGLTLLFLVYLIAARSLIVGFSEIIMAIELRKEINYEWFLILLGAVSILFGIILAFSPALGILYIVLLLSIYSAFAGVTLLTRAWDLRTHAMKTTQPTS